MSVEALTADQFNDVIADTDVVVVDFWAPWCGPCLGFAPIFEQVATELSSEHPGVSFRKVNTDDEQGLAGHFQIQSIPTLMIFREQIIVFEQAGALAKSALKDVIKQVLELDMKEVRRGSAQQDAEQE